MNLLRNLKAFKSLCLFTVYNLRGKHILTLCATLGLFAVLYGIRIIWYEKDAASEYYLSMLPPNLKSSPVTDEDSCKCHRLLPVIANISKVSVSSTCDAYATRRGPRQNVAAFSMYGNLSSVTDRGYFLGIAKNFALLSEFYPGWIMRVYHSLDTSNPEVLAELCKIWCQNANLDFCQVGRLPQPLGDVSRIHGMVWRFLVLGDPLVDRFIVRDLDSLLSQREADAVADWIRSNLSWHSMRDNVEHNRFLLGGMWGGTNRDLTVTRDLQNKLVNGARGRFRKQEDQVLLQKYVWPVIKDDCLSHDSYLCEWYTFSKPWPSQRHNMRFVGQPFPLTADAGDDGQLPQCPLQCRPAQHKDWLYC